jgi:hypothetical protein
MNFSFETHQQAIQRQHRVKPLDPPLPYRLRRLLDRITRRVSAFDSFQDLLDAHPSYTPSIYPYASAPIRKRLWYVCLATQYDRAQAARNDPRRCYTGSHTWTIRR